MKHRSFRLYLRVIALATLISFVGTSVVDPLWAQTYTSVNSQVQDHTASFQINVPQAWGKATDQWQHTNQPQSDLPNVILINDIHTSLEGQKHIARLIRSFTRTYPIESVLMEGVSGPIDMKQIFWFPSRRLRYQTAAHLLSRGQLHGVEFAQVLSHKSFQIYGIENPELYREHLSVFQQLLKDQQRVKQLLDKVNALLKSLKSKLYPDDFYALNQRWEGFQNGSVSFHEFAPFLLSALHDSKNDLQDYPLLKHWQASPEILSNPSEWLVQVNQFLSRAFNNQLTSSEARQLFEADLHFKKLEGLIDVALNRTQYEEFKAYREEFYLKSKMYLDFLNDQADIHHLSRAKLQIQDIIPLLQQPDAFYDYAIRREKFLVKQTQRYLKRKSQKTVIVVAGGFHAEGLKKYFRRSNVSYVEVSPALSQIDRRMQQIYLKSIQLGEAAFSKILNHLHDAQFSAIRALQLTSRSVPQQLQDVNLLAAMLSAQRPGTPSSSGFISAGSGSFSGSASLPTSGGWSAQPQTSDSIADKGDSDKGKKRTKSAKPLGTLKRVTWIEEINYGKKIGKEILERRDENGVPVWITISHENGKIELIRSAESGHYQIWFVHQKGTQVARTRIDDKSRGGSVPYGLHWSEYTEKKQKRIRLHNIQLIPEAQKNGIGFSIVAWLMLYANNKEIENFEVGPIENPDLLQIVWRLLAGSSQKLFLVKPRSRGHVVLPEFEKVPVSQFLRRAGKIWVSDFPSGEPASLDLSESEKPKLMIGSKIISFQKIFDHTFIPNDPEFAHYILQYVVDAQGHISVRLLDRSKKDDNGKLKRFRLAFSSPIDLKGKVNRLERIEELLRQTNRTYPEDWELRASELSVDVPVYRVVSGGPQTKAYSIEGRLSFVGIKEIQVALTGLKHRVVSVVWKTNPKAEPFTLSGESVMTVFNNFLQAELHRLSIIKINNKRLQNVSSETLVRLAKAIEKAPKKGKKFWYAQAKLAKSTGDQILVTDKPVAWAEKILNQRILVQPKRQKNVEEKKEPEKKTTHSRQPMEIEDVKTEEPAEHHQLRQVIRKALRFPRSIAIPGETPKQVDRNTRLIIGFSQEIPIDLLADEFGIEKNDVLLVLRVYASRFHQRYTARASKGERGGTRVETMLVLVAAFGLIVWSATLTSALSFGNSSEFIEQATHLGIATFNQPFPALAASMMPFVPNWLAVVSLAALILYNSFQFYRTHRLKKKQKTNQWEMSLRIVTATMWIALFLPFVKSILTFISIVAIVEVGIHLGREILKNDSIRGRMNGRATSTPPLDDETKKKWKETVSLYAQSRSFVEMAATSDEEISQTLKGRAVNALEMLRLDIRGHSEIDNETFRTQVEEISQCFAEQVKKYAPPSESVVLFPWRAAMPFAGALQSQGYQHFWHLGVSWEQTAPDEKRSQVYYKNDWTLPEGIKKEDLKVVVPVSLLATGNSMHNTLSRLVEMGVRPENITITSIITAPEGVARLIATYPGIRMLTVKMDDYIDEAGLLRPGVGDFSARYFDNITQWAPSWVEKLKQQGVFSDVDARAFLRRIGIHPEPSQTDRNEEHVIYDATGEPTSEVRRFKEIFPDEGVVSEYKGALHASVHLAVMDPAGRILLQKRGKNVMEPNTIDVSASGRMRAGQTPEVAVKFEAKNEMGLTLDSQRLIKVPFDTQEMLTDGTPHAVEGSNEIVHFYVYAATQAEIDQVVEQKAVSEHPETDEVADFYQVKWDKLRKLATVDQQRFALGVRFSFVNTPRWRVIKPYLKSIETQMQSEELTHLEQLRSFKDRADADAFRPYAVERETYVTKDGGVLPVYVSGNPNAKRVVVSVFGMLGPPDNWRDWNIGLHRYYPPSEYQIYNVVMRGYEPKADWGSAYVPRISRSADDLYEFIVERLKNKEIILEASSKGGEDVLEMARRHGEDLNIRALVGTSMLVRSHWSNISGLPVDHWKNRLLDKPIRLFTVTLAWFLYILTRFAWPFELTVFLIATTISRSAYLAEMIAILLKVILFPLGISPQANSIRHYTERFSHRRASGVLGGVISTWNKDYMSFLKQINFPVMLIYHKEDNVIHNHVHREVYKRLKNNPKYILLKKLELEEGSHFTMVSAQYVPAIRQELQSFLDDVYSGDEDVLEKPVQHVRRESEREKTKADLEKKLQPNHYHPILTGKGAETHYSVVHDTPNPERTLVFVHGVLGNPEDFTSQLLHLIEKHGEKIRLVVVKLRGYWDSDLGDSDPNLDHFVEDLQAVYGRLGIERAGLVAHSVGGTVALAFKEQYPQLVEGVAVMSPLTTSSVSNFTGRKHDHIWLIRIVSSILKLLWRSPDLRWTIGERLVQMIRHWQPEAQKVYGWRGLLDRFALIGYETILFTLLSTIDVDLSDSLRSMDVPTLWIAAPKDSVIQPSTQERRWKLVQENGYRGFKRFHILRSGGHNAFAEPGARREVNQMLDEWLESLDVKQVSEFRHELYDFENMLREWEDPVRPTRNLWNKSTQDEALQDWAAQLRMWKRKFIAWSAAIEAESKEARALEFFMKRFDALNHQAAELLLRHGTDVNAVEANLSLSMIQVGNFYHFLMKDTATAVLYYAKIKDDSEKERYRENGRFNSIFKDLETQIADHPLTAQQVLVTSEDRSLEIERNAIEKMLKEWAPLFPAKYVDYISQIQLTLSEKVAGNIIQSQRSSNGQTVIHLEVPPFADWTDQTVREIRQALLYQWGMAVIHESEEVQLVWRAVYESSLDKPSSQSMSQKIFADSFAAFILNRSGMGEWFFAVDPNHYAAYQAIQTMVNGVSDFQEFEATVKNFGLTPNAFVQSGGLSLKKLLKNLGTLEEPLQQARLLVAYAALEEALSAFEGRETEYPIVRGPPDQFLTNQLRALPATDTRRPLLLEIIQRYQAQKSIEPLVQRFQPAGFGKKRFNAIFKNIRKALQDPKFDIFEIHQEHERNAVRHILFKLTRGHELLADANFDKQIQGHPELDNYFTPAQIRLIDDSLEHVHEPIAHHHIRSLLVVEALFRQYEEDLRHDKYEGPTLSEHDLKLAFLGAIFQDISKGQKVIRDPIEKIGGLTDEEKRIIASHGRMSVELMDQWEMWKDLERVELLQNHDRDMLRFLVQYHADLNNYQEDEHYQRWDEEEQSRAVLLLGFVHLADSIDAANDRSVGRPYNMDRPSKSLATLLEEESRPGHPDVNEQQLVLAHPLALKSLASIVENRERRYDILNTSARQTEPTRELFEWILKARQLIKASSSEQERESAHMGQRDKKAPALSSSASPRASHQGMVLLELVSVLGLAASGIAATLWALSPQSKLELIVAVFSNWVTAHAPILVPILIGFLIIAFGFVAYLLVRWGTLEALFGRKNVQEKVQANLNSPNPTASAVLPQSSDEIIESILLDWKRRPDPILIAQLIHEYRITREDVLRIAQRLGFEAPRMTLTLKELHNILPLIKKWVDHARAEFPGAKFVFMGRDGELMYDIFRLILADIGEQDRAILVPASMHLLEGEGKRVKTEHLGFYEGYGITKEAIEAGQQYVLMDTAHRGSAPLAFRQNIAEYFYDGPNAVDKIKNVFPMRLLFSIGQIHSIPEYEEVRQLMTFDRSQLDDRTYFPRSFPRVSLASDSAAFFELALAGSIQLMPRYHAEYRSIESIAGKSIGVPLERGDIQQNVDAVDGPKDPNQSVVNPVAALLIQLEVANQLSAPNRVPTAGTGGVNLITPLDHEVADYLIARIQELIEEKGKAVLALPTGETPRGVYQILRDRASEIDWSKVVITHLDEYLDLTEDRYDSFADFIQKEIVDPLTPYGLKRGNVRLIQGTTNNPEQETDAHEAFIASHGGIDIAFVGIGRGPSWKWYKRLKQWGIPNQIIGLIWSVHLAFNESGTSFASRTHLQKLKWMTRRINKIKYKRAITMGLQTITDAKEIVLMAKGEKKRSALEMALNRPITRFVPASILMKKGIEEKVRVFADKEASPDKQEQSEVLKKIWLQRMRQKHREPEIELSKKIRHEEKIINGSVVYDSQLNPGKADLDQSAKKFHDADGNPRVSVPFDPNSFHFSEKWIKDNLIWRQTLHDRPWAIALPKPLNSLYHMLVVPKHARQNLVQENDLQDMMSLLDTLSDPRATLVHTSLSGGAGVNSLHFHLMFDDFPALDDQRIRWESFSNHWGVTQGIVRNPRAPGIFFDGYNSQRAAQEAERFVRYLTSRNIPFNIFMRKELIIIVPRQEEYAWHATDVGGRLPYSPEDAEDLSAYQHRRMHDLTGKRIVFTEAEVEKLYDQWTNFAGRTWTAQDAQVADELITHIRVVAQEAAQLAKERRAQFFDVWDKSDGSRVTQVDYDVQRLVFKRILEDPRFKDVFLKAEEDLKFSNIPPNLIELNNENEKNSDFTITFDPLDGTGTYLVRKTPFYSFSLGITYRGRPLYSVIVSPELEETGVTWEGDLRSHRLRVNGRVVKRPKEMLGPNPFVVAGGSPSRKIEHPFSEIFERAGMDVERRVPSIALFSAMIASGKQFDAISTALGGVHDVVAPAIMMEAAGLSVLREDGSPFFPMSKKDFEPPQSDRFLFIAGVPSVVEKIRPDRLGYPWYNPLLPLKKNPALKNLVQKMLRTRYERSSSVGDSKLFVNQLLQVLLDHADNRKRAQTEVYRQVHDFRTDPDWITQNESEREKIRNQRFYDAISSQIDSLADGAVLVDIGAEKMGLSRLIAQKNPRIQVKALDLNESDQDQLPTNLAYVKQDNPLQLPLPDQSADMIVLSDTLHHIAFADQAAFLNEVRRVLRPNGIVLVGEITYSSRNLQIGEESGLPSTFKRLIKEHGPFFALQMFAFIDWYRMVLVGHDEHVPMPYAFKTMEEWKLHFQHNQFYLSDEHILGTGHGLFVLIPTQLTQQGATRSDAGALSSVTERPLPAPKVRSRLNGLMLPAIPVLAAVAIAPEIMNSPEWINRLMLFGVGVMAFGMAVTAKRRRAPPQEALRRDIAEAEGKGLRKAEHAMFNLIIEILLSEERLKKIKTPQKPFALIAREGVLTGIEIETKSKRAHAFQKYFNEQVVQPFFAQRPEDVDISTIFIPGLEFHLRNPSHLIDHLEAIGLPAQAERVRAQMRQSEAWPYYMKYHYGSRTRNLYLDPQILDEIVRYPKPYASFFHHGITHINHPSRNYLPKLSPEEHEQLILKMAPLEVGKLWNGEWVLDTRSGAEVQFKVMGNPKGTQTMVFMHGLSLGEAEEDWIGQIRYVERFYPDIRIIVIHHRGYRRSKPGTRRRIPSLDLYVRDVELVLEQLPIPEGADPKVILAGHSMSGGVAWRFKQLHPNRVKALVVSAPFVHADGGVLLDASRYLAPLLKYTILPPAILLYLMGFPGQRLEQFIVKRVLRNMARHHTFFKVAKAIDRRITGVENEQMIWDILPRLGDVEVSVHLFGILAVMRANLLKALDENDAPALWITGDNDKLVLTRAQLKQFGRLPPDVPKKLVIVPNGGHYAQVKGRVRVNRALDSFLSNLGLQRKSRSGSKSKRARPSEAIGLWEETQPLVLEASGKVSGRIQHIANGEQLNLLDLDQTEVTAERMRAAIVSVRQLVSKTETRQKDRRLLSDIVDHFESNPPQKILSFSKVKAGFLGTGRPEFLMIHEALLDNPAAFLHEMAHYSGAPIVKRARRRVWLRSGNEWLRHKGRKYKTIGLNDYLKTNYDHYVLRAYFRQVFSREDVRTTALIRRLLSTPPEKNIDDPNLADLEQKRREAVHLKIAIRETRVFLHDTLGVSVFNLLRRALEGSSLSSLPEELPVEETLKHLRSIQRHFIDHGERLQMRLRSEKEDKIESMTELKEEITRLTVEWTEAVGLATELKAYRSAEVPAVDGQNWPKLIELVGMHIDGTQDKLQILANVIEYGIQKTSHSLQNLLQDLSLEKYNHVHADGIEDLQLEYYTVGLREVFKLIYTNSLAHSGLDEAALESIARVSIQEGKLIIELMDNGQGFNVAQIREIADREGIETAGLSDEDAIQIIFDHRFSRRGKEHPSHGEGLAYVKAMIEDFHGGKITASNRTARQSGALFTIELPLIEYQLTSPAEIDKPLIQTTSDKYGDPHHVREIKVKSLAISPFPNMLEIMYDINRTMYDGQLGVTLKDPVTVQPGYLRLVDDNAFGQQISKIERKHLGFLFEDGISYRRTLKPEDSVTEWPVNILTANQRQKGGIQGVNEITLADIRPEMLKKLKEHFERLLSKSITDQDLQKILEGDVVQRIGEILYEYLPEQMQSEFLELVTREESFIVSQYRSWDVELVRAAMGTPAELVLASRVPYSFGDYFALFVDPDNWLHEHQELSADEHALMEKIAAHFRGQHDDHGNAFFTPSDTTGMPPTSEGGTRRSSGLLPSGSDSTELKGYVPSQDLATRTFFIDIDLTMDQNTMEETVRFLLKKPEHTVWLIFGQMNEGAQQMLRLVKAMQPDFGEDRLRYVLPMNAGDGYASIVDLATTQETATGQPRVTGEVIAVASASVLDQLPQRDQLAKATFEELNQLVGQEKQLNHVRQSA